MHGYHYTKIDDGSYNYSEWSMVRDHNFSKSLNDVQMGYLLEETLNNKMNNASESALIKAKDMVKFWNSFDNGTDFGEKGIRKL